MPWYWLRFDLLLCYEPATNLTAVFCILYKLCCVVGHSTLAPSVAPRYVLLTRRAALSPAIMSFFWPCRVTCHRHCLLVLSITDVTCPSPISIGWCFHRHRHTKIKPLTAFLFRHSSNCLLRGHVLSPFSWFFRSELCVLLFPFMECFVVALH
jgi:hypothetical protein